MGHCGSFNGGAAEKITSTTDDVPFLALEPIYRFKTEAGVEAFATSHNIDFQKISRAGVAFFAVCTNLWPAGLVPLFAVRETNRFELLRRPIEGEENSSEPIFFALPPEEEVIAGKIAGHWSCLAIRGDGSKVTPDWYLAVEGEKLSGRFDQNTDYRVANITGGTFVSNKFELHVAHVNDRFELTGEWKQGKLSGKWRRTDNEERGTWQASRPEVVLPAGKKTAPLYEWRRADGAHGYTLGEETLDKNWIRSPRPLCRVWL